MGVFEQDQHEWRFVPFQAPQWPQRHVSGDMGPIPGKYRLVETAASHDQQTDRSASFVIPQWGQSQLNPTIPPSRLRRKCQSTEANKNVARKKKRRAVGSRSSTEDAIPRARGI